MFLQHPLAYLCFNQKMLKVAFKERGVIIIGSINSGQGYMFLFGFDVTNNKSPIWILIYTLRFKIPRSNSWKNNIYQIPGFQKNIYTFQSLQQTQFILSRQPNNSFL